MTRPKANAKKQRGGVDFKKIRRKIGRKLPPPKNTTNTEIKSKAIVLPEQSVAAERGGLAVNKKGLTLKELLQQTSHHNAKVRRDALIGIKDLFSKYPAELKLNKYAAVEKLRERISDDDKVVRKSLYDLFKLVILPGCKEDNQELIVSLMMAYIFNAMTHLAADIRIMAFDFLDLVLEFYPPSFSSYAEKIFQNYEDILRKNQYYLQDKGKLNDALAGLVRCLSLLPWIKEETDFHHKDDTVHRMLHAFEANMSTTSNGFSHTIGKLKDLVPVLINSFQEFIPLVLTKENLEGKSFGCMTSILHSIDLIVRSFVHGSDKKLEFPSSKGRDDMGVWDVTVSSAFLKKLFARFPLVPVHHLSEKDSDRLLDLNMIIAKIFFELNEWICLPPILFEKFLGFLENALLGTFCRAAQSGKAVWEKHLVQLLSFIPKFVSRGAEYRTSPLLSALTQTFKESKSGSLLKLACLSTIEDMLRLSSVEDMLRFPAIEDMLPPNQSMLSREASNLEDWKFHESLLAWIGELPQLLIQLGDKHPACSLFRRAAQSGKAVWEKHLVQLLCFILQFVIDWTPRLLRAFTQTFKESQPGSLLKLACLSTIEDMLRLSAVEDMLRFPAIEDMLPPNQSMLSREASNPKDWKFHEFLLEWIGELPQLLIQLGDKHPACSLALLRLQLRIGQRASLNSPVVSMYDNMQYSLQDFYSTSQGGEHICHGPFLRLPRESQELSLCCLYYFSHLDLPFLKSISSCCLSPDLDSDVLFQILAVLHTAYTDGRIKIADYLSVIITLVLRFKVPPESGSADVKSDTPFKTLKSMTGVLCSYMEQMGDNLLVLQMIEKVIIDQIRLKPSLDNSCSLLRMLVTLDSKPTRLSEQSINTLVPCLTEYLMHAAQCIPEDDKAQQIPSNRLDTAYYYLLPCFFLFDRCHKLMSDVLMTMGSAITESSLSLMSDNGTQLPRDCLTRVNAIASVLVFMHKDAKLKKVMSVYKEDFAYIIQQVLSLQSSKHITTTIEDRHKIQILSERLNILLR